MRFQKEEPMSREGEWHVRGADGASPALPERGQNLRAAMVSTGLGIMAMVLAPAARSAGNDTPAPVATITTPSLPQVAGEAPSRPARTLPKEPEWIQGDASAKALVYPPSAAASSPQPVTVMLHGMCGHPQNSCAPFVDVSTSRGWLVCPQGEDECGTGGTGAKWRLLPRQDARVIEASVAALASEHPADVDTSASRVLVGFSLGGMAAVQIAEGSPSGEYTGLVIIASQVHPDANALKRAGIKRVVLAAGDLDMTSAPLRSDARALASSGVPTRFVSLGAFGHGYPADMQERMREPMQWVAGG
jgi:predicted esterase